jgi:adenine-specific DNA-methyltransferase
MRSELDVLLDKIADTTLRADIRSQVDRLRAKRTFGLVFESHLPERVCLPEHEVRVGVRVAYRDEPASAAFEVTAIKRGIATLRKVRNPDGSALLAAQQADASDVTAKVDTLVVFADFGEPVFPGLRHLGGIAQGGEKPAHVVIKGENHHVLEALQFTHAGKVDCIYIDPPYNSGGARDWKYDNNYVDENDSYRHSKWLAFMERRLILAKQLLNPEDAVLIVTIDEKEYLRLGLLLEQLFAGCKIQMINTVISAKGTMRKREFSRVHEHVFAVLLGKASVTPWSHNMLDGGSVEVEGEAVEWLQLRRREPSSTRASRPNQFFPIFVHSSDGTLHSIGNSLPLATPRDTVKSPAGTIAFWPINTKNKEMVWGLTPDELRQRHASGYFRLRNWKPKKKKVSFQYLPGGTIAGIESGRIHTSGHDPDGAVRATFGDALKGAIPKTVWNMESHNAENYGTKYVSALIGRRFPFPKSLYAVEDTLRFFVGDKPAAIVLDFFGGSGTTTHAVARLNRQDGGRRQSIVVTNNEVSADEADELRAQGLRPGDVEWEKMGIFEHITRPRITAAMTGRTPEGDPVKGDYKFIDEFPMAQGLPENVEFFELTYLDPEVVELDRAFNAIAPLMWLRAGARGPIIDERLDAGGRRKPYAWTARYGVLFNPDRWRSFVQQSGPSVSAVFIVTDSQTTFAGLASELPAGLDVVRLYENYLSTFAINRGYM